MQIQRGSCDSCGFVGTVGNCPGHGGLYSEGCEVTREHFHCASCGRTLANTWSDWDIRTPDLLQQLEAEKAFAKDN